MEVVKSARQLQETELQPSNTERTGSHGKDSHQMRHHHHHHAWSSQMKELEYNEQLWTIRVEKPCDMSGIAETEDTED